MGFAIIAFVLRIWKLQEPIALRSDLALITDLSQAELQLIAPLYQEVATMSDAPSLSAYEARAHRFERIAKWLPPADATQVRGEADLIQREVAATQARARVRALRARVTEALRGRGAVALYVLFVLGVIALGLAADWLLSERTDRIVVAKACADARSVSTVVEEQLPAICGKAANETKKNLTPSQELAKASNALSSALVDSCECEE
jgi:hypothetical protein